MLTGKPVTIKLNEQKSIFFLFTYKTTDRGELFWKSVLLTPFNKICDRESLFLNGEPCVPTARLSEIVAFEGIETFLYFLLLFLEDFYLLLCLELAIAGNGLRDSVGSVLDLREIRIT